MRFRRKLSIVLQGIVGVICLNMIFSNFQEIYRHNVENEESQLRVRNIDEHNTEHKLPRASNKGLMKETTSKDDKPTVAMRSEKPKSIDNFKISDTSHSEVNYIDNALNTREVKLANKNDRPNAQINVQVNENGTRNQHIKDMESTSHIPVLIVAYQRSGSTWLGDIIQQSEEAFYMFEPFHPFIQQGYYTVGSVCYNNNTCRLPTVTTETESFAIFSLMQLFSCRFERLPRMYPTIRHGMQTKSQLRFSHCMKITKNSTKCSNILKKTCLLSKIRVVKTIRVSMTIVEKLAKLLPGLKVIHLLRDPRGITLSRQKGNFKMAFDLESHSKMLCSRLEEDIDISRRLTRLYNGSYFTIAFEAMTDDPFKATAVLYAFLGMNLNMNILKWLLNVTHGSFNNGYYKTMRKDSAYVAYKWRAKLKFEAVTRIDIICRDLYSKIGYIAIPEQLKLNDSYFKTRTTFEHNHCLI